MQLLRGDTCAHASGGAAPAQCLAAFPGGQEAWRPHPPGFCQGPRVTALPHAQPAPHNPSSRRGPHSQPFMSADSRRPQAASDGETSLREGFLGHSHCCPLPWAPQDNKGAPTWRTTQRMSPPRGRGPVGSSHRTQAVTGDHRGLPGRHARDEHGPGAGGPWPNPNSANSAPYSPHHRAPTGDLLAVGIPQEHPSCLVLQIQQIPASTST